MIKEIPEVIVSEEALDNFLATPYYETLQMMRRLEGDIMILGAGGKIGPSLVQVLVNACQNAGIKKRLFAVDLFAEGEMREKFDQLGVETIPCDLLNPQEVEKLPRVKNIIFMAGMKFGIIGSEALTWMINVIASNNVARAFRNSKIVVFSTGCVYALVSRETGGSVEADMPSPIGEYANSCLGRERIFEYYSNQYKTPVLGFRLNYAIDLRYGVLVDVARNVYDGKPVDRSVDSVNFIWQGDAVNRAILCLEHTSSPLDVLNVTGEEIVSIEVLAEEFGKIFNESVTYTGMDLDKAYLSNASRSVELFGKPFISTQTMIKWVADWIQRGGRIFDKPTHFQVTDGQFLDEHE